MEVKVKVGYPTFTRLLVKKSTLKSTLLEFKWVKSDLDLITPWQSTPTPQALIKMDLFPLLLFNILIQGWRFTKLHLAHFYMIYRKSCSQNAMCQGDFTCIQSNKTLSEGFFLEIIINSRLCNKPVLLRTESSECYIFLTSRH